MGILAANPKILATHASKGPWRWVYRSCLVVVLAAGVVAVAINP
jgi:hypothetical protein